MKKNRLLGASYEVTTLVAGEIYPDVLKVDIEAQRNLKKARVNQIAKYILSGVGGESVGAYFAPIVASRRSDGKLYIMDGQHRYFGTMAAITILKTEVEKVRLRASDVNLNDAERETSLQELSVLEARLKEVQESDIPMMIYSLNGRTVEERQVFHDLNLFQKKVSLSLALSYDSSDPHVVCTKNVLELPELEEFRELVDFGVVGGNKVAVEKLFLFSTVKKAVVQMLGKTWFDKGDQTALSDKTETLISGIFEIIYEALPEGDEKFDDKYMYSDAKWLQGVASFVGYCIKQEHVDPVVTLKEVMKNFDWTYKNHLFKSLGGATVENDEGIVFTGTTAGIKIIRDTLLGVAKMLDEKGAEV